MIALDTQARFVHAGTNSPRSMVPGPRSHAAAKRRAVVFALLERGRPTLSLLRAFALSRLLSAELHVLRILPKPRALVRRLTWMRNGSRSPELEHTMRAIGSTRSWLRDALGDSEAEVHAAAITAHGDFIDVVSRQANQLGACMIITPPSEASLGAAATALACKANVPVMVARPPARADTIIAATDLESPTYPVLRTAATLGGRLEVPIVAVHNFWAPSSSAGLEAEFAKGAPSSDITPTAREAKLVKLSSQLAAAADAVVHHEPDPVAAILGEAQTRDADLIVVGARRRGWRERPPAMSVSTQIVDRAKRSVLVTPLKIASG